MTAPFIDLGVRHQPKGVSDRITFAFTKILGWTADTFWVDGFVIGPVVAAMSIAAWDIFPELKRDGKSDPIDA
jgi:hypothetical protein